MHAACSPLQGGRGMCALVLPWVAVGVQHPPCPPSKGELRGAGDVCRRSTSPSCTGFSRRGLSPEWPPKGGTTNTLSSKGELRRRAKITRQIIHGSATFRTSRFDLAARPRRWKRRATTANARLVMLFLRCS